MKTNNSLLAISLCKKLPNSQSQYMCHKNKVKYSQYCYWARQHYCNTSIIEEFKDAAIIMRSKNIETSIHASINTQVFSVFYYQRLLNVLGQILSLHKNKRLLTHKQ